MHFSGPVSADEVWLSCLDVMMANGMAEAEPLQMTFDLAQFWATLTLLDAYRMALLRRRLARQAAILPAYRPPGWPRPGRQG